MPTAVISGRRGQIPVGRDRRVRVPGGARSRRRDPGGGNDGLSLFLLSVVFRYNLRYIFTSEQGLLTDGRLAPATKADRRMEAIDQKNGVFNGLANAQISANSLK
ncbi:hypothetical protein EMIT0215P_70029 [Pseudomonas serboccidentalis]